MVNILFNSGVLPIAAPGYINLNVNACETGMFSAKIAARSSAAEQNTTIQQASHEGMRGKSGDRKTWRIRRLSVKSMAG